MRPDPKDPEFEAKYRAAYQRANVLSASLAGPSVADRLVALGAEGRAIWASLSPLERARLAYCWAFWARPKQRPPVLPAHRILLYCGGRGSAKSRTVAERIRERIDAGSRAGVIVGATIEDVERYQIGGKESDASRARGGHGVTASQRRVGLLDVFPPSQRPIYHASKGEVQFHTGAVYSVVSAQSPEYRGGNIDTAWADEMTSGKISRAKRAELWANIRLSSRLESDVPVELLVSCTPTPDPWLRALVADPACVTIFAESEENRANLARGTLEDWAATYGNSRRGRQELKGEILDDVEGALFSAVIFDETRWRKLPPMKRIVVAVDPAISTERRSDDTAIVAAGRGEDDDLYLLAARSGKWTPEEWAGIALDMRAQVGAECIVGERNRGGDLVASNVRLVDQLRALKKKTVSVVRVENVLATKGKASRLTEVQTLHEQGRLHSHPDGLPVVEDDATTWDPAGGGPSPNGADAMAWAAFYLYDGWGEAPEEQERAKRVEAQVAAAGTREANQRMSRTDDGRPGDELW